MPIVIGIFCLIPLGIGVVLEYLCCRIPKRRIWRALPPALSVLFVVIVGVGRWNMWTSEEVSPVTQLILFPGLPGIFLLIGFLIKDDLIERVRLTASVLLAHLALLFVPAGVGIVRHWDRISAEWVAIAAILVIGTAITMVVTAFVIQFSAKLMGVDDDD